MAHTRIVPHVREIPSGNNRTFPADQPERVHEMTEFFANVETIQYEGPDSTNPLAFRWYDADRVVGDKTMREHLRFGVCYWHSFAWDGFDIFGAGTLDRPWHPNSSPGMDPMDAARMKADAAFEF